MTDTDWPVHGLRLVLGDLELRPAREADVGEVAALMAAAAAAGDGDGDTDPTAPTYPVDPATAAALYAHQRCWSAYGSWRPEAWRIPFAVRVSGELVGTQDLEGDDFAVLRTVDSASWLAPHARGHGYGKAMRRAVLALAFGPMAAEEAVSSAWPDNAASLGVSRALGYLPNGVVRHRRTGWRGGADDMVHLRLSRAGWLASGLADGVEVSGFEPCRPLLGIA